MTLLSTMNDDGVPSMRVPSKKLPALFVVLAAGVGCEAPNPLLPAEPIGTPPVWGQSFNEPASGTKEDSLVMGGAEGPAPTGPGEPQRGGTAVPGADPMAGEKWGGGDARLGTQLYGMHCAMCHGAEGAGGNVMGLVVPTLRDASWHERMTDNQIAVTVAHGKGGMPAFVGKLEKSEINAVVAYLRTLKATTPARPQAPAGGGY
jgi:mono/diheme cytochrome c family protein